jgi:glycosyltransferase involved in cell wall biosynthesis
MPTARPSFVAGRGAVDTPRISVVTPSYNQAQFLDGCMRSVLSQGYPNLEYIVIDGGSSDGSVDIIKSHETQVTYWVSEPDGGQYDALNKGFRRATGEILAWLNADDMYLPWTFAIVADILATFPDVEWISSLYPLLWDRRDLPGDCRVRAPFSPDAMLAIHQESTFWRRGLWERSGAALDTSISLAADLELWARFWRSARLYAVAVPLAGMRIHTDQRSVRYRAEILDEARAVLDRYGVQNAPRDARRWYAALPRIVRRLLAHAGVPYRWGWHRAPIIRQRDERWCIDEVYV